MRAGAGPSVPTRRSRRGRALTAPAPVPLETAWKAVHRQAARLRESRLRDLFAGDPARFRRFCVSLDDLTVDLSKEKIDVPALEALLALARAAGVEARRDAMAAGEAVNATERRGAGHMSLRGGAEPPPDADVRGARERFTAFAEAVRDGSLAAAGGAFRDVVSLGIGGSHLGPVMACRALRPDSDGPRLHFVANLDAADLADAIAPLDPRRTLVIVASKSFGTEETLLNAGAARAWLARAVGDPGRHMAAVSAEPRACAAWGIGGDRVFPFWDWVGGRMSIWSAAGLPLAIAIGKARFERFLAGAAAMDRHFRAAPLEVNLPVLLALVAVWRRNAMGWPAAVLAPYGQRLERFPAYLQQLEMESNGKRVTSGGRPVATATAPLILGEPGTNAQHSFFQWLHQGTDTVPVDFIVAAEGRDGPRERHARLLAHCLAQGQALAFGRGEDDARAELAAGGAGAAEIERLAPHLACPGDRPSTTILHRRLDPFALGRLIALYEHKVFVEGVLWDINPFDQWGVELGKKLARSLRTLPEGDEEAALDGSTAGLLRRARELSG